MASKRKCQCDLVLNSLRLPVKIGWSAEERAHSQTVRFDLRIRFENVPQGCYSDSLEETLCYANLADQISQITEKKDYKLVEHLAFETFASLRETLKPEHGLWLKVTKETPPLPYPNEGASVILQDLDSE